MSNVTLPGDGAIVETVDGVGGAQRQVVQVANFPGTGLTDAQLRASPLSVTVSDGSGPLTVDGTVAVSGTVPVSGTFFQTTQPVSASALPLPAGAATEASVAAIAGSIVVVDAPAGATPSGQLSLGIRKDSDLSPISADGDYHPFLFNAIGRLKSSILPGDTAVTTGTITSAVSAVPLDVRRQGNAALMMAGTFAGVNVTFEASLDSTTGTDGSWFTIQGCRTNANTIESTSGVLGAAPAYAWEFGVSPFAFVRARATAWTSGAANLTWKPGANSTEPAPASQVTATQPVSGTVTANVTGYPTAAASADGLTNPTVTQIGAAGLLFNGTTWDRERANFNTTTGDTGAKVATGNGATQTNFNAVGATVVFNVGAVTGTTPTMVLKLQGSADSGTTWYDIPGASTASLTATGVVTLQLYPGLTPVANAAVSAPLPRTWRVVWTIGGTTPSFTITNVQVAYQN